MHLDDNPCPSTLVGGSPALCACTQAAPSHLPLAMVNNQYHDHSDCYSNKGHQHTGLPVASEGAQLDCGVNVCPERHVENL